MKIEETLADRGKTYGSFTTLAETAQAIKGVMWAHDNWSRLSPRHKEALELIATKIARILNGDPDHADNWADISGYSTLGFKDEY